MNSEGCFLSGGYMCFDEAFTHAIQFKFNEALGNEIEVYIFKMTRPS